MNHGELWDIDGLKALIISSSQFNELAGRPVVAPIVRGRGPQGHPYIITLAETDPVSGVVALPGIQRLPDGERRQVGIITGATMARVSAGLHDLFAY